MNERYSLCLRLIHWTVAGLVVVQISLALLNIILYEPRPVLAETLVQTHISLGVMVLGLTILRLFVRAFQSQPPMRPAKSRLNLLAKLVHGSLYLCLIVLPLSGYVKLASLGFVVQVFAVLDLPELPFNVAVSRLSALIHTCLSIFLGILLVFHIFAAILHRAIAGVPVMHRMSFRPTVQA